MTSVSLSSLPRKADLGLPQDQFSHLVCALHKLPGLSGLCKLGVELNWWPGPLCPVEQGDRYTMEYHTHDGLLQDSSCSPAIHGGFLEVA